MTFALDKAAVQKAATVKDFLYRPEVLKQLEMRELEGKIEELDG